MEIRTVIHSTVAPSSRMHSLSTLPFLPSSPPPPLHAISLRRDTRGLRYLASYPLAHARLYVLSLVSTFSAFYFLLSNDVVLPRATPRVILAPNVTLVADSSTHSKRDGKKVARVTSCHRPNQTSIYTDGEKARGKDCM